jgi:hypothetical protein
MKLSFKSAAVGITTLALAGGFAALGATSAFAAGPTSPQVPYSPDAQSVGAIHLYDAAGNVKTSGLLTDAPFAAYAVADGIGTTAGDTKATLYIYTPVQGKQPFDWDGNNQLSLATTYPAAGVPSSLVGPNATASISADQTTLDLATSVQDGFPNVSTSYAGLYELRMITSLPSPFDATTYYSADIKVTGNTWTLVNPVPAAVPATTTTVTATPATGATTATPVTLNATVSPAAAGSVQFKDGATNIGAAQPIAAGGTATVTNTFAAAGAKIITAEFTPTNAAAFAASTGTLNYTVGGAIISTTIALAANPQAPANAYTPVTLNATVAPTSVAGSVQFFDGTTSIGTAPIAAGIATLATGSFGPGAHNVTAKFLPGDAFSTTSTSQVVVVTAGPAAGPVPDPQTVQVKVLPGSLLINTPYTVAAPLILPDMALNLNGNLLSTTGQFGTVAQPIQVTDTRAGNLPWTASALASPFDDGSSHFINAQNLGLTDLQYVNTNGNALSAANVSIYDNVAANGVSVATVGALGLGGTAPHKFAAAANGNGTIGFTGTMTLNAPTSTVAGIYTSTVTFTIG